MQPQATEVLRIPPRERRLHVRLHLTAAQASNACAVAALINCVVLAGTWWFGSYLRQPEFDWSSSFWTRFVLVQFNLGTPNVAATWYASMLLLVVCVLSVLCLVFDRLDTGVPASPSISWGWAVLAAGFALLSLDEMVFLDERLGLVALHRLGEGGSGSSSELGVALAGLALFVLAFAWLHLRAVAWVFPFMALGLVRFVSLPLYEALGHNVEGETLGQLATVLQESSELFGTVCFLAATAAYLAARPSASQQQRPRAIVPLRATIIFMAFAATLLGVASLLVHLLPPEQTPAATTGSAQNWPSAAAAVLVALACAHTHAEPRPTPKGGRTVYVLTAVYSVAVSGYVGSAIHAYGHWKQLYPLEVALLALIATSALVLGVRLARRIDSNWGKAAAVLWAVFTAGAFMGPKPWTPYLVYVANAVLLVSLPLHLDRRMRID